MIATHTSSPLEIPGTSGEYHPTLFNAAKPLKVVTGKDVPPSFILLSVPEIKTKKKTRTIKQKLPKALSSTEALRMLQEKESKKQKEDAKQKRNEEKEVKKKQCQEEKERKKQERNEKKKLRDELKKNKELGKQTKSRKRMLDKSSSDSEPDVLLYADTDDDFDE